MALGEHQQAAFGAAAAAVSFEAEGCSASTGAAGKGGALQSDGSMQGEAHDEEVPSSAGGSLEVPLSAAGAAEG